LTSINIQRRCQTMLGAMIWLKIETAPFDRDLEVAVVEDDAQVYVVVFPCRRVLNGGWIKAATGGPITIHPTHWREWQAKQSRLI
jgi:hypothetical protein